ncbi:MAG: Zn-dependent hydrolase [Acidobacteria bacterium]|nr:Zn-dependent hydrolase [Acidobacteriota bacterium]MBS1867769.1 Zn-dependent hydrolase [Acidobacteriota bacterium]
MEAPIPQHASESAQRVIAELRELAALTSTPDGAQRLAWGPVWRSARKWLIEKLDAIGLKYEIDAAGNLFATFPGLSGKTVLVGSHVDSVPNGGWLDGALGVVTALEAVRHYAAAPNHPVTLKLVDFADEEGARFGHSLLGSGAAAGTLDLEEVRSLKDKQGTLLVDALKENGVELNRMLDAHASLKRIDAKAYLEFHIEQGGVLESQNKSTGVVLGTFGLKRHMLRFVGQAAHSGATPIHLRRDAFLAAASFALECREIARRHSKPGAGVVCTCGVVKVEPGIVTAVPGVCEISIDQRALDAGVLALMVQEAQEASRRFAAENNVTVEWKPLFSIDPRPFDPKLLQLCEESVREITGDAPKLPSGPLHDAANMVPHMPTVMMFAHSARGLSHCKEEDTPMEHLEPSIRAFLLLVEKTIAHVSRL